MDLKESDKYFNTEDGRHPWELARFEILYSMLSNYLNSDNNSVLDIGCGDLFFLSKLSSRFYNTIFIGVDPMHNRVYDEIQLKELKNKNISIFTDIDLINTNFYFHFILLLDVLEHLSDDISFLKNIVNQKFISSDSIFLITVPAFQRLFSSHDVFLEHHKRYSNNSIKKVVETAGLTVIDKGYFFFSLLFLRVVTILLEKTKIKKYDHCKASKISNWNANRLITLIIKELLLIDYQVSRVMRIFGINLIGLSNYIICQKRA